MLRGGIAPGTRAAAIMLGALVLLLLAGNADRPVTYAKPGLAAQATAINAGATIVVRARRREDLDRVATFALSTGYTVSGRIEPLTALRVEAPAGVGAVEGAGHFISRPGVLYAEPDYAVRRADVPTDPLYAMQAPYLQAVHAPEAWDVEKGAANVIVAVLDTGIDVTHPDLQGRIWSNPREVANNSSDDDRNGCVDDAHGCAFISDPSPGCSAAVNGNITDDLGHGTFVSGIIAADGGNGQGMVGVARNVTIMPVKVLDCTGTGDALSLAEGMIYAAQNGARIMNISLGGPSNSAILLEAVRIVHDQYGALVVAAAGNSGESGVEYPARYPQVLAVGAASRTAPDRRAPFSTSGPEVDVVAVGESIVGTVPRASCGHLLPCLPGNLYAVGDGTSFAAPQVAGLVALMLSHRPALRPDAMLNAVKSTADPVPPGDRPDWAGSGRINMLKSLTPPQFRIGIPGATRS